MGKIEQACRFRLDSGYGIAARSEGVVLEHEKAIGDAFNDSMNNLFPELGSSILSCTIRGRYVLYARNTLRTDIHGRKTIFTHSYVMDQEDYGQILCSCPQQLLGVSMNRLMDSRGSDSELPSLEPGDLNGEILDRDELFEKYGLNDPARYTLLLTGAYEALSSGRSLRLYLNDMDISPEQTVRELVFCMTEGLVKYLRRRINFSSGGDTRMSISILRGRERSADSDMVYDVFDTKRMNIRVADKLKLRLYEALGSADREERKLIVERVEEWVDTNLRKPCSAVQVLATAYVDEFMRSDERGRKQYLTKDLRLLMFRAFVGAAGKSVDLDVANDYLCNLLEEMKENGGCTVDEISNIAEWYLMESSPNFRCEAKSVLEGATVDIRLALLDAVLELEEARNKPEMIGVLVNYLEPEEFPDMDLRKALIRWISQANEENLWFVCQGLVMGLAAEDLRELGMEVVGRNAAIVGVSAKLAEAMLGRYKSMKLLFDQEDFLSLDNNIAQFSEEMKSIYAEYVVNVRLKNISDTEEKVRTLSALVAKDAKFGMIVGNLMAKSEDREAWECFVTAKALPDDIRYDQMEQVLPRFRDNFKANGVYEKRVEELLMRMFEREFRQYHWEPQSLRLDMPPLEPGKKTVTETYVRRVSSHNFAVSNELKTRLKREMVERFWDSLDLEEIMLFRENKLEQEVRDETGSLANRDNRVAVLYDFWKEIGAVKESPRQEKVISLITKIRQMQESQGIKIERFLELLGWLTFHLVRTYGLLPMDLLLPHANRFVHWTDNPKKLRQSDDLRKYLHDCQKAMDEADPPIRAERIQVMEHVYPEQGIKSSLAVCSQFPTLIGQLKSAGEPPAITKRVIEYMENSSKRASKTPGNKQEQKKTPGLLGRFFGK